MWAGQVGKEIRKTEETYRQRKGEEAAERADGACALAVFTWLSFIQMVWFQRGPMAQWENLTLFVASHQSGNRLMEKSDQNAATAWWARKTESESN